MPPTMTFDEPTRQYHMPLFGQSRTPGEIVACGEDIADELAVSVVYDVPRELLPESLLLVGNIERINVV